MSTHADDLWDAREATLKVHRALRGSSGYRAGANEKLLKAVGLIDDAIDTLGQGERLPSGSTVEEVEALPAMEAMARKAAEDLSQDPERLDAFMCIATQVLPLVERGAELLRLRAAPPEILGVVAGILTGAASQEDRSETKVRP